MTRTLHLRRETLSELTPGELVSLAGASGNCTVELCVTEDVDRLRERIKDATNFTRESGCTPAYGGV